MNTRLRMKTQMRKYRKSVIFSSSGDSRNSDSKKKKQFQSQDF